MAFNKNQKNAQNNQWAGQAVASKAADQQMKTEFSNEWVSTNKMASAEDVEFAGEFAPAKAAKAGRLAQQQADSEFGAELDANVQAKAAASSRQLSSQLGDANNRAARNKSDK